MAELLKSLFKRIQDGASELGDAIHGDRIERELDNDIRAIDLHMHQARNDAATTKAQRITREDEAKRMQTGVAIIEAEVADLLSRRRRSQARAKAARAVALQNAHAALQRECKELKGREIEFAQLIAQFEDKLRRAKHQLGTLRAASGLQRAQAAVAKLQPGPAPYPESAQVSAQRARQRKAKSARSDKAGDMAEPRHRKPIVSDADADADADADVAIDALLSRLSAHAPAATTITRRTTRKPT